MPRKNLWDLQEEVAEGLKQDARKWFGKGKSGKK